MNYYAGLDVSLEETAICVVDGSGLIVKEVRAASEPEALIAALKAIDVPLERIGLEACSLTAWLHDGLWGAGLPAICIETRQANAAMKTMPNKTDRNDARALIPPRSVATTASPPAARILCCLATGVPRMAYSSRRRICATPSL